MFDLLLRRVANLFVTRAPGVQASASHLTLLLAIVLAGAAVRLWGLGGVGLHGDEETMAMPTMHIVEHGTPVLPSGMFYARAISQLYLMAGSVELFGESEWAFRLPSALCGVLLIVLAWLVGRRFLAPAWNLVFTAVVAFLPAFIVDAQTARMYVFLVTSLAAVLILIFRWERTARIAPLLGAVLMMIVALQFHTLAVFGSFMFFFPGVLHADRRKLLQGLAAFGACVIAFFVIDAWVGSFYPPRPQIEYAEMASGPKAAWALPDVNPFLMLAAMAVIAALAFAVARRVRPPAAWWAGALIAAGLAAQLGYFYHLALLLLASGAVVALRHGRRTWLPLAAVAAASAALLLAHVLALRATGVGSYRRLFGALVGQPSVWPYIVTADYSIGAAAACAAGVAAAWVLLARRGRLPDFLLFFALGVWVPLLAIGVFTWYLPLRYTAGVALPLLLSACAAAQWLLGGWLARQPLAPVHPAPANAVAAMLVALLVVNPVALARTAGAGYAIHPDHKGAAEFIRTQRIAPDDILLAEDVLQQTYYLRDVDYWLIAPYVAAQFTEEIGGELRDIYTAVPALTSAEELERLIERTDRGAIYVIGSGEQQSDGRRHARGPDIYALLHSGRFKVIYEGRDGLTRVWKIDRARPAAEALEANAGTTAPVAAQ